MICYHLYLVDYSILIRWISPFVSSGVSHILDVLYLLILRNSVDTDQTPQNVAFHQGLCRLPMSFLYACLKNGRVMLYPSASIHPFVRL